MRQIYFQNLQNLQFPGFLAHPLTNQRGDSDHNTPFVAVCHICRLGFVMFNLRTKFDVIVSFVPETGKTTQNSQNRLIGLRRRYRPVKVIIKCIV